MKISFCLIAGNEQDYAERLLDCFEKDFDELCLVRAVGNQEHDKTVSLCKEWCEKRGKEFRFAEYRNDGWKPESLALSVSDENPATWQHVDDFAAARNVAWLLATKEWQLWADFDDILAPDSAGLIRECAESGKAEYYFFTYGIKGSNQTLMRERLLKTGSSHWMAPIHENCRVHDTSSKWVHDERVIYSHEPDDRKKRDPERNRRIAEYHLRYLNAFAPEIQREWHWKWQAEKDAKKKTEFLAKAEKWANISLAAEPMIEQRCSLLINMAEAESTRDMEKAITHCWQAARLMPNIREPWGVLAELYLKDGQGGMADFMATLMQIMRRPQTTGMPVARRFYEDYGFYLRMRTLRACGQGEKAQKEELGMFTKHGSRISLLHATRGRPAQALETRGNFLRASINPLCVEHIFAIDEDDAESIEALKLYRHVIVKEPRGCVKAWNAAATFCSGHVLVQLSDDWLPCIAWDERIWLALKDEAVKRNSPVKGKDELEIDFETNALVESTPLVLAISDGHRKDALLCMAILTRARYLSQGYLFHPDYRGLFSDNEFTKRAYDDGVVLEAKEIVFDHTHPIFAGKPYEEWDEGHRRQMAPGKMEEGQAIFIRRNQEVRTP